MGQPVQEAVLRAATAEEGQVCVCVCVYSKLYFYHYYYYY